MTDVFERTLQFRASRIAHGLRRAPALARPGGEAFRSRTSCALTLASSRCSAVVRSASRTASVRNSAIAADDILDRDVGSSIVASSTRTSVLGVARGIRTS